MANVPVSIYNEIYVNGDWVDNTAHVRSDAQISISRGFANENAALTPSACQLTLNDPDGRYNRRNPLGVYYGSFDKNTSIRNGIKAVTDTVAQTVSNGWGAASGSNVWVNGTSSGGTVAATNWTRSGTTKTHSVPAADAYRSSDLTGPEGDELIDSEARFRVTLPTNNIAGGGLQVQVRMRSLDSSNFVNALLDFSTTETVSGSITERIAGSDRTLLRSTTIAGLSVATDQTFWVSVVIEAATVLIKVWADGDAEPADYQLFACRATIRAGYTSIVSRVLSGNSNTKPVLFAYNDFVIRLPMFAGFIDTLTRGYAEGKPPHKTVEVTAYGSLGQTNQSNTPLDSPMTRSRGGDRGWVRETAVATVSQADVGSVNVFTVLDSVAGDIPVGGFFYLLDSRRRFKEDQLYTVLSKGSAFGFTDVTFTPDASNPIKLNDQMIVFSAIDVANKAIAYWPCEDEEGSSSVASGLPSGPSMVVRYSTPEYQQESRYPGSAPLLKFNGAEIQSQIPDYPNTNQAFSIQFCLAMPDPDDVGTGQDVIQFFTTGTGVSYDLQYEAAGDGSLQLQVFNSAGTVVFDTGSIGMGLRGVARQVILTLEQSGGNVLYTLRSAKSDGTSLTGTASGTVTGVGTLGKITKIAGNPGGGYVDVGFGQLTVIPFIDRGLNYWFDMTGNRSEQATHRLTRLCYEENLPFSFRDDGGVPSAAMGVQRQQELMRVFQDCVDSDLGVLYDTKSRLGIEYCSRGGLLNQDAFLTLSLVGGELQPGFVPVDDNSYTRNEITVSRDRGSSAVARLETGPMSVLAPSDGGAGRFPDAPTIYTASDGTALTDQAEWRLHMGTVDEDRYPKIKVVASKDTIPITRLFSVNVGYQIAIANNEDMDSYGDINQLVLGYRLMLNKFVPSIEFNCAPASPYRVIEFDDGESAWADTDSELDEDLTTTETAIDVRSASGHWFWTTDVADFPLDIIVGGEVMTVTAISGTANPQTFTVTRSVNGVVKTHDTGSTVELYQPRFYSL